MGEAAEAVLFYTFVFLYVFFKVIVIIHAVKNKKGSLQLLAALIPGFDLYYYFKYIKVKK